MTVRPATAEDARAVERVAQRSWEHDYPDVVSQETASDGVDDWYDADRIRAELDRPDATVLVATDDGVVGFVHAVYSDGVGHLMRVYVDPDARGAGHGRALVEAAVDRMFAQGAERVRAMVLADNAPGNEFYDALGFEETESRYETQVGDEFHEESVWVTEP